MHRSMLKLVKRCREVTRISQPAIFGVVLLSAGISRTAASQVVSRESQVPRSSLAVQAYEAGTAASRQFLSSAASNPSQDGESRKRAGAVPSRSTVLWASGIVATSIVVAAFLLRSRQPCRAPLTIEFSPDWWKQVTESLASNRPPEPPPPPPIVMPTLPKGCYYG